MEKEYDKHEFEKEEARAQNGILFHQFKELLRDEFKEEPIHDYWNIMEKLPIEDWQDALKLRLGEMDEGEAPWIQDTYIKVTERIFLIPDEKA